MSDTMILIMMAVATWRLTRLLVRDELPLIKTPRDALANLLDPPPELRRAPLGGFGRAVAYLIECPWCMSVWIAGGMVAAVDRWAMPLPTPLLWFGAVAAAAGLITMLEGRVDAATAADQAAAETRAAGRRTGAPR